MSTSQRCGALVMLCLMTAVSLAHAQVAQPPPPSSILGKDGRLYRLNANCTRNTDKAAGIVKRDACGRWYCGRKDVKELSELRPNLAAEIGCVWRLEGEHCRCMRNFSVRPNEL